VSVRGVSTVITMRRMMQPLQEGKWVDVAQVPWTQWCRRCCRRRRTGECAEHKYRQHNAAQEAVAAGMKINRGEQQRSRHEPH